MNKFMVCLFRKAIFHYHQEGQEPTYVGPLGPPLQYGLHVSEPIA